MIIDQRTIFLSKHFGIVDRDFLVLVIKKKWRFEKPKNSNSNLAIIGRYILTPDIFDILKNTKPSKGGEIQITDALLTQAKKGKVIAYKFKGRRFDCGGIKGYIEATNYFAKQQGIV